MVIVPTALVSSRWPLGRKLRLWRCRPAVCGATLAVVTSVWLPLRLGARALDRYEF